MSEVATLEALGINAEELRGEVVTAAARMLLEDCDRGDADSLYSQLQGEFRAMLREEVKPRVDEALHQAFEAEFIPTNQYGERKPGAQPITLREYITSVVQEHIKLGDNREGYSYDRNSGNTISKWLNEEVAQHVRKELWSQYQAIADAVVERACSTIRQQTDDALKRRQK
jgi:uncharacterized protein (DUF2267 family)